MRAVAPVLFAALLLVVILAPGPARAERASGSLLSATLAAGRAKRPAKAATKAATRPTPPPPEEKAAASPAPSTSGPAGAPSGEVSVGPRGPTRIDFDDRLIQGQTNKSGAVYLFDRKELSVRSMVRQRTSFRDQIVKDILTE